MKLSVLSLALLSAALVAVGDPVGAASAPAAPASTAGSALSREDVGRMIQADADMYSACNLANDATFWTPKGKEDLEKFARHLHGLNIPKSPTFVGNDGIGDPNTRAVFYAYSAYRKSTSRMIAALVQTYAAWGIETYSTLRRAKIFYEGSEMAALRAQLKGFEKDYIRAKQYGPDIRARKKVAGEKLFRLEDITFHDIWIGSGMADYMNENLFLKPCEFTSRCAVVDRWNAKLPPSRLQAMRETANNGLRNLETLRKTLDKAAAKFNAANLPPWPGTSPGGDIVAFDDYVVYGNLQKSYRQILSMLDDLERSGTVAYDLRTGAEPKTAIKDTDAMCRQGEIPSYRQAVKGACFRVESAMRHAYEETYGRKMPKK